MGIAKHNGNKWKGNDLSINECLDEYNMVYQYNGVDFHVWVATEFDDNGFPTIFQPFSISNRTIDDYFEDDGDDIAKMCGVSQDEMDYEWKLDAMLSYYSIAEFVVTDNNIKSRDELYEMICDNWFGVID